MKVYIRNVVVVAIMFVCGCVSNAQRAVSTENVNSEELPLPNVPDVLREPSARAAYITEHFWDAMEFNDTLKSHNNGFMEQNFSNFINILPYADKQAQEIAVEKLMRKAEADSAAYIIMTEIAEKYLYEPESPMYSEELYVLFLEQFIKSPMLGSYGTLRYRWQYDETQKNRRGTIAANFSYITRDGKRTSLHETSTADFLLLIFYDPDCEHCNEIIDSLKQNEVLNQLLTNGKLTILAINSGYNKNLWEQTAALLPTEWIVGYENGAMQNNGSYVLRAMPTLYLLDFNKEVILKDVTPDRIIAWF